MMQTTADDPIMSFDPQEVRQLVGQIEMDRGARQYLGLEYDGRPLQLAQGYYYASQLHIDEPRCLGDAHTERAPSLASSATRMSPTFDTLDGLSTYSSSTAPPPLHGPVPTGLQRPMVPDHMPSWLPCEFRRLSGCNANFDLQDTDAWIAHIIDEHLHKCFPKRSICWFCDGIEFKPGSNRAEEREKCFWNRMYHIAGHFQLGKTAAEIRPDFFFLDHLHGHQLIDEATFQWAKSQGEFPSSRIFHEFRDEEAPCEVYEERARSSRRTRQAIRTRHQRTTHRHGH